MIFPFSADNPVNQSYLSLQTRTGCPGALSSAVCQGLWNAGMENNVEKQYENIETGFDRNKIDLILNSLDLE